MKREQYFLTCLGHSFRENNSFFYKISDMPHIPGSPMRFDRQKPFDAFACYLGIPIAIEAKAMPEFKSFGLKQLRPNQAQGLEAWAATGGRAFVFLNVRRRKALELGITETNRLYIFDWNELKAKGQYSKAELLTLPHVEGKYGRYRLDRFLVSLFIPLR